MSRRSFWLAATLALGAIVPVMALVTPFIDVDMGVIAQGKSVKVHGPGGDGILLFNKEDLPVHVEMKAAAPLPGELSAGADVIPDAAWIRFQPQEFTLLPHKNKLIAIDVLIPAKKEFSAHAYETFILTRMTSGNPTRVEIVGVLRSRLRFHVK